MNLPQEMQRVPILVYANKQDLPNALSCAELITRLDLNKKGRYLGGISFSSQGPIPLGQMWVVLGRMLFQLSWGSV